MYETYNKCCECRGTRRIANGCTHCRGNGYVRTLEIGRRQLSEPAPRGLPGADSCPRCHGRGYELDVCRRCEGYGYLEAPPLPIGASADAVVRSP